VPGRLDKDSGQIVEVNGAPIHYYDAGEGEALVLLHGGGPGATGGINYADNNAPLSVGLRVIVPDLPGFGRSELGDIPDGYLTYAADAMAGLLDHLGIEQAHFVGNSLGGGTTLTFALREPERAGKLILLNPAGSPAGLFSPEPGAEMKMLMTYYDPPGASYEKMLAFCEEMVFSPASAPEAFVTERYEESIQPGRAEGQQRAIKSLKAQEAEEGAGSLWLASSNVRQPTLLLWGREDRAAPLDKALMWLRRIPDARLTILPNCGHWIQMEYPGEFERLTVEFIGA
jgi:pimeloyl-ACP methyl ester carboxylesterase